MVIGKVDYHTDGITVGFPNCLLNNGAWKQKCMLILLPKYSLLLPKFRLKFGAWKQIWLQNRRFYAKKVRSAGFEPAIPSLGSSYLNQSGLTSQMFDTYKNEIIRLLSYKIKVGICRF